MHMAELRKGLNYVTLDSIPVAAHLRDLDKFAAAPILLCYNSDRSTDE